ncbi:MAG: Mediator of RNA polymerase II transcription subunit 18 [Pleopsidium flavum]|nr:MAG: Mediator of RNA polymerase II transcription subunit 18 [Pleopsidium flavum]
MHELLLFAQVPPLQHNQLLKILAGVAGMQPHRVVERHLIFKPRRSSGQSWAPVGGSQGVQNSQTQALQGQLHNELFYLQLVGEVSESSFGSRTAANVKGSEHEDLDMRENDDDEEGGGREQPNGNKHQQEKQAWSLEFRDFPEVPGRRPVTSRMMSSVDIVAGDAAAFLDSLGYSYASEYVLEGQRFIHQNLILLLHRVMQFPTGEEFHSSPRKGLHTFESVMPLDPSGAYVLQASIRIQDGSKPESISVGINELKAFKEMMRGVVDLDVGDRLALDTRVR